MLLSAYFDESGMGAADEPFAVAGFVFTPTKYKQFSRRWRAMLSSSRLTHFHMTDLVGGYGEFRGRSIEERHAILKHAVDIILGTMTVGVGARYSQLEFESIAPSNWPIRFGSHFSLTCQMAVQVTKHALNRKHRHEKVLYIFETGHKYANEANAVLGRCAVEPDIQARTQYGGHSFLPKGSALGLEAADLLAWSAAKEMVIAAAPESANVSPLIADQIIRLLSDRSRYLVFTPKGDVLRQFIEDELSRPVVPNTYVGPRKRTFR